MSTAVHGLYNEKCRQSKCRRVRFPTTGADMGSSIPIPVHVDQPVPDAAAPAYKRASSLHLPGLLEDLAPTCAGIPPAGHHALLLASRALPAQFPLPRKHVCYKA